MNEAVARRLSPHGVWHVRIEPAWRILDIGCRGGQTMRSMAAMATEGRVDGVDHAPGRTSRGPV